MNLSSDGESSLQLFAKVLEIWKYGSMSDSHSGQLIQKRFCIFPRDDAFHEKTIEAESCVP